MADEELDLNVFEPPPPAPPHEKRYRVIGEQAVLGHLQGDEFSATLPFDQEELFTQYGHLEVVSDEVESAKDEETNEVTDSDDSTSEGEEVAPLEPEQPDLPTEEQE